MGRGINILAMAWWSMWDLSQEIPRLVLGKIVSGYSPVPVSTRVHCAPMSAVYISQGLFAMGERWVGILHWNHQLKPSKKNRDFIKAMHLATWQQPSCKPWYVYGWLWSVCQQSTPAPDET